MELSTKITNTFVTSLLFLFSLSFSSIASATSDPLWAKSVTAGADYSFFNSIAVDSAGNTYAVGDVIGTGTFNFGDGVTATGKYSGNNIILVKYDSNGKAQWAKSVTDGPNNSVFNSVAVDSAGNIYAAGWITGTGTYNFDGATATGTYGGNNIVLVKYNNNGQTQWAKSVTAGTSVSIFNSIAVDSAGNIYAAGWISGAGTYNFGGIVSTHGTFAGGVNIVLVKYDNNGDAQWANSVTSGTNASIFYSVALDSVGNIYAVGNIYGTDTFDFGGATAAGTYSTNNIVLVKYDNNCNALWAKSVTTGTTHRSTFYSVAVDSESNVYAAGYIYGTGTFYFGGVSTTGAANIFNTVLVKYDNSGNAQWAKSVVAGTNGSQFRSICVDSEGNIYAAGYIYNTDPFDFDNGITVAGTSNTENVVLVKYDNDGYAQWAKSVTAGTASSFFNSVTLDSEGNIYTVGYIYGIGTFDFGNGVTTYGTNSTYNIVLVKYESLKDLLDKSKEWLINALIGAGALATVGAGIVAYKALSAP
jgi:hypothetical protein